MPLTQKESKQLSRYLNSLAAEAYLLGRVRERLQGGDHDPLLRHAYFSLLDYVQLRATIVDYVLECDLAAPLGLQEAADELRLDILPPTVRPEDILPGWLARYYRQPEPQQES